MRPMMTVAALLLLSATAWAQDPHADERGPVPCSQRYHSVDDPDCQSGPAAPIVADPEYAPAQVDFQENLTRVSTRGNRLSASATVKVGGRENVVEFFNGELASSPAALQSQVRQQVERILSEAEAVVQSSQQEGRSVRLLPERVRVAVPPNLNANALRLEAQDMIRRFNEGHNIQPELEAAMDLSILKSCRGEKRACEDRFIAHFINENKDGKWQARQLLIRLANRRGHDLIARGGQLATRTPAVVDGQEATKDTGPSVAPASPRRSSGATGQ